MNGALGWWRSDYSNSGHFPDSGPTGHVECRWQYDVGYFVTGAPVVVDDVVHVATASPHLTQPNLHGTDVEDGSTRYTAPVDDPGTELRGSPTVLDSTAYVTVLDEPPLVRGYDIESGERVRGFDLDALSLFGIPPILEDDSLYAVTDYSVSAIDLPTGDERWRFAPVESFRGAAAFVDGTLFIGSAEQEREGEPIETGDEEWPHARQEYPWLRALDAKTGAVEWELELEVVLQTVAVVYRTVFCCGSEPYSRYVTFDSPVDLSDGELPRYAKVHAVSTDGEVEWTAELDAAIRSAPAVGDGTVIVGTEDGEGEDAESLIAYDASAGERLWTRPGSGGWTAAAVAAGIVYAGNGSGYVEAADLEDGTKLWRFETSESVHGPPFVSDDLLCVGDAAGNVYAIEEET